MASEIPRWKASPKQYQEEQTNNDGSIVSDTIEDDSSQSAEYFSNKMLAPLGFTEFSPNQRGSTHKNAISNIEVSEVDDPNKIGAVDLAASRTKMTDSDYDYSFGVWLTWKDVWVTVPYPRGGSKTLVQGLTGYAQPGKMVAIMGPSGSGKSTLLDVLAGRWGGATKQAGDILLNGRREALSYGTSAYVTQDDILMETLTVGEAVFYSAQLQLPDSMSTTEKKERAKITIKQMGLDDAVNISIGGWRMKGLSGGQKRRVSIAIEILTRPMLLFLDEPTSGLDSAAAYHVMKRIATLARDDGRTVIASIHQPSGEVFELFHSLYLLAGGRTVYFGQASQTSEFFAVNGFPCPFLRNPCDHYLRTINSDFERDIEEGDFQGNITTSQVINKLVMSYHSSSIAKTSLKKINEISKREGAGLERKGSQASFMMQTYVLIKRSFVNMYRDLGYYWLRVAIYITLCLCVGTIYFNVGQDYGAIQARGSMLMFVAAFLTFMAIGGFPSFVEDMKVFRRERLNGHYGVMAFVIANTVSSIPYLMLISVFPGAIAYFLVNLHGGFEHFMFFVLVLFSCMTLVESLMMMVASIVPNFLLGIITGAGIQGVMMLNGGFFRLPNDLPKPFWRYPMYYISFHKYANQGFYKNDFSGLNFTNNQEGASPLRGEDILRDRWQVEIGYSKWMDLFILLGMVIVYRVLFFAIIKFKEKMRPLPRAKPPNQISPPALELTT